MEDRHTQKDTLLPCRADPGIADRRFRYHWNDRIPGCAYMAEPRDANGNLIGQIGNGAATRQITRRLILWLGYLPW